MRRRPQGGVNRPVQGNEQADAAGGNDPEASPAGTNATQGASASGATGQAPSTSAASDSAAPSTGTQRRTWGGRPGHDIIRFRLSDV